MTETLRRYWQLRLEAVQEALEANNFTVHLAPDGPAAKALVLDELLPALAPRSISWGGSGSFKELGLYDALKPGSAPEGLEIIDTYEKGLPPEEVLERRRRALLTDLYITGTNALTENGMLVNLDMIGNRIAALTFGPRNVLVIAGRNKLVPELDDAMGRIKTYAAPANALRLDKKTPCVHTATCHDCKSVDRICNTWTITEKSYPKGRVLVLLVNEDLGL